MFKIVLEEPDNLTKMKFFYGQFLLEMTYEHKIHQSTIDKLNESTKKIFSSFLDIMKVKIKCLIPVKYLKITEF